MTKLYLVQQRRSICRMILFSVFLEFAIVNKCSSNKEICSTRSRTNISYFQASTRYMNWTTARQECNKQNASLPVICNQNEQEALTNYLKRYGKKSAVWTSAKKINFNNWTWIDDKLYIGGEYISTPHVSYTHVAFVDRLYKAQSPQHKTYYLCMFSGFRCSSGNVTRVTNGCVTVSDDDRTWYDARTQCLMNGGDLAILSDDDFVTLNRSKELDARNSYWIGLRLNSWIWTGPGTANLGADITYTNWSKDDHSSEFDCSSIDALNGEWKTARCQDKMQFVCEGNETMSSTPSSTEIRSVLSTTTMTTTTTNITMYVGLGVGIAISVICVTVIIFVLRYRRKSHKQTDHSKHFKQLVEDESDESVNKPINSPVNASVQEPAPISHSGADDMRGVYAEISLSVLSQSGDAAEAQHPGFVYASLDFTKEPNHFKSDVTNANRT